MRPASRAWTRPLLLALAGAVLACGEGRAESAAGAAPPPPGWLADDRTGCKVWNPWPEPGESVRWSGGCEDGLASGPGVTEWIEQGLVTERTEGGRVAGHLQGRGVQTLANGDRFEGSWKDDRRNGQGAYTAADGRSYVGEFKDDRFEGFGVMEDAQGNRYEGGWKDGRRNGPGTFTGADGTRLSGVWVDDELIGGPRQAL